MSDAKNNNNKTGNEALNALIGLTQVAATEYVTANVVNNQGVRISKVRVVQQDGNVLQLLTSQLYTHTYRMSLSYIVCIYVGEYLMCTKDFRTNRVNVAVNNGMNCDQYSIEIS